MSFFDKFKSFSAGPQVSEEWNHPDSEEALKKLFEPDSGIQLIYKHSFACHICTYSLMSLEKQLASIKQKAGVHFIDVRAQRPLSSLAAELSGVQHQSPQAILLYNGKPYWSGSHAEVRSEPVMESIEELIV